MRRDRNNFFIVDRVSWIGLLFSRLDGASPRCFVRVFVASGDFEKYKGKTDQMAEANGQFHLFDSLAYGADKV